MMDRVIVNCTDRGLVSFADSTLLCLKVLINGVLLLLDKGLSDFGNFVVSPVSFHSYVFWIH